MEAFCDDILALHFLNIQVSRENVFSVAILWKVGEKSKNKNHRPDELGLPAKPLKDCV